MNLIPLHAVKPEYKRLLSTDMMQARAGCRRCHGRGHVGFNLKRNVHIPCGCVVVDMDMLAEALNKVAIENKDSLKVETNIDGLIDQPHTEAVNGDKRE